MTVFSFIVLETNNKNNKENHNNSNDIDDDDVDDDDDRNDDNHFETLVDRRGREMVLLLGAIGSVTDAVGAVKDG